MADSLAHPYNRRRVLTIDNLPDDVLLAIFDFYVVRYQYLDLRKLSRYDIKTKIEWWQSLIHVCRQWRGLVFGSPRRLNLQLYYAPGRSARRILDVWPALPLVITAHIHETSVDDVIAKLKHSDRICQIDLICHTPSSIENFWTAMQVPFPELEVLRLSFGGSFRFLPDSFLGGSAPRLRYFHLHSIPFPGLPKLLLSATHLVHLSLSNIPYSGYISPETMATCLSVLTNLEELHFYVNFLVLENRSSPPPTRAFLPALTKFWFRGIKAYLEDLVSRIDAPRLCQLSTTFFHDIDFDGPELNQFISRTPTFGAYNEARLIFAIDEAGIRLQSHNGMVEVQISQRPYRQLLSLAQICTSSLGLLLTMENLYIDGGQYLSLDWPVDIENTEWLDVLLPFTAVKNLYLSKLISPSIAPALQELTGERTIEVLPALKNVLLEGFQPSEPVQEGIAQFISARQLTNRPVAISIWERYPARRGH